MSTLVRPWKNLVEGRNCPLRSVAGSSAEEMQQDERVILLGEDIGIKAALAAPSRHPGIGRQFGSHRVLDLRFRKPALRASPSVRRWADCVP
jgi:hypothetical protein